MSRRLSPELQEDIRRTQRRNRDEIVRKAYAPARVHPMEAAERELVRQEAERAAAGSGKAVALAREERHAYLGTRPCGCFAFVGVDEPDVLPEIAEDARAVLAERGRVERLSLAEAKARITAMPTSCGECS